MPDNRGKFSAKRFREDMPPPVFGPSEKRSEERCGAVLPSAYGFLLGGVARGKNLTRVRTGAI